MARWRINVDACQAPSDHVKEDAIASKQRDGQKSQFTAHALLPPIFSSTQKDLTLKFFKFIYLNMNYLIF
jgi:hypothetical protein